jgi:Carboxypeptidase regulatory-like domain
MRRGHTRLSALIAVLAGLTAAAAMPAASIAQSPVGTTGTTGTTSTAPAGLITGHVTDASGQPVVGVSVAAAVNGSDAVAAQTTTDSNGAYALVLAPGSYIVAFNALDPTDDDFAPVVYGGPGPTGGEGCQFCHGQAQVVTNLGDTAGIDAVLRPPVQTGTVRPLSGHVIKVIDNHVTFRFGCHENGIGCEGKGVLRIGGSTQDPVVSTVSFEVAPNHTKTLEFAVPAADRARLKKANRQKLQAIVQLTTGPSSTTTKFTLTDRS